MEYLFIYGSLKRSYWNHWRISDEEFVGEFETEARYSLYELPNGLPVLVCDKENGKSIKGEIYHVTEGILTEHLDPMERGAGYDRIPISIKDFVSSAVFAYIYAYEIPEKSIDCGNEWPAEQSNLPASIRGGH